MSIKDILKKYSKIEIELLLCYVLGRPKEFLYMEPNFILTSKHLNILTKLIKRRLAGEPVAYILGYKDFFGLRFKVNKNVLIPRPETEMVIDEIINLGLKKSATILDIGTGSGCIAVSLAKMTSAQITASDISTSALSIAKQNAGANKAKVKFIKSDLLKSIKFNPDIIIANLPYGWNQWKNNTSAQTIGLKFEPKQALFTKENGLFEIRRLLEQIKQKTNKPKKIYLEFDPRQKDELAKLIKNILPKVKLKFIKDFRKLWRYVIITIN